MCNRDIRIARRQVGQPLVRLERLARTPGSFVKCLALIFLGYFLLVAANHVHVHVDFAAALASLDWAGIGLVGLVGLLTLGVSLLSCRLRSDRLRRLTELSAAAAALQAQAVQLARAVRRYAAAAEHIAAAVLRIAPHEDPQAAVSGLATVCLTPRLVAQRPFAARVCAGMLH